MDASELKTGDVVALKATVRKVLAGNPDRVQIELCSEGGSFYPYTAREDEILKVISRPVSIGDVIEKNGVSVTVIAEADGFLWVRSQSGTFYTMPRSGAERVPPSFSNMEK